MMSQASSDTLVHTFAEEAVNRAVLLYCWYAGTKVDQSAEEDVTRHAAS